MSGDTQPTLPFPLEERPVARRRRRGLPWIIAIVIIAGLAVVAWFVAEHIARDILTRTVREQIVTQLALPEDQQIDVGVNEPVLPQVLGKLCEFRPSIEYPRQDPGHDAIVYKVAEGILGRVRVIAEGGAVAIGVV